MRSRTAGVTSVRMSTSARSSSRSAASGATTAGCGDAAGPGPPGTPSASARSCEPILCCAGVRAALAASNAAICCAARAGSAPAGAGGEAPAGAGGGVCTGAGTAEPRRPETASPAGAGTGAGTRAGSEAPGQAPASAPAEHPASGGGPGGRCTDRAAHPAATTEAASNESRSARLIVCSRANHKGGDSAIPGKAECLRQSRCAGRTVPGTHDYRDPCDVLHVYFRWYLCGSAWKSRIFHQFPYILDARLVDPAAACIAQPGAIAAPLTAANHATLMALYGWGRGRQVSRRACGWPSRGYWPARTSCSASRSPRSTCRPRPASPIADHDLASRLSFFLWSSAPDAELLGLATEQRLSDPDVLERQVEWGGQYGAGIVRQSAASLQRRDRGSQLHQVRGPDDGLARPRRVPVGGRRLSGGDVRFREGLPQLCRVDGLDSRHSRRQNRGSVHPNSGRPPRTRSARRSAPATPGSGWP